MSINSKILTYAILFIIVILFLGLGLNSVTNVKSAEVTPETKNLSTLIETGNKLTTLSEILYNFIQKSSKINPEKIITIEDSNGTLEEFTQIEFTEKFIDKFNNKLEFQKTRFIKISDQMEMTKYKQSFDYYNEAINLLTEISEEIRDDIENEDCSEILIPGHQKFLKKLGKNNYRIKHYIESARKNLKGNH